VSGRALASKVPQTNIRAQSRQPTGSWGVTQQETGIHRQRGWPRLVKVAVDRTIAASALVATAPLMGLVSAGVWLTMGRPILFRQERPGRGGRPFTLVKFRTMRVTEAHNEAGSDELRLTRFGHLLRSLSLDEIPQFINVLKGDMSLVGPRPLLTRYLERYTPEQARRHDVLPGITGLAQINGRNATTWEERLRWDVHYVDTWSLGLDARILLATVSRVLRRSGISSAEAVTMPEFLGDGKRPANPG